MGFVLSIPFCPSCVIGFISVVSSTSALFFYPDCSSWASGDIVAGASVRVAIAIFVGSKDFSAFTQDTVIS